MSFRYKYAIVKAFVHHYAVLQQKKGIELRSYTKDRYIKHSTTKEVIYFHLMSIEDFLYVKHSAIGYKDDYI